MTKFLQLFFIFAGSLSRWLNVAEILAVGESHLFFFVLSEGIKNKITCTVSSSVLDTFTVIV